MQRDFFRIHRKITIAAICICAVLGGFYLYISPSGEKADKRAIRPAVRAQEVVRQDMYRRIALSGQTVAKAKVDIAPKYAGKIVEVFVELGDAVEAGDVLLTQDTDDVEIALQQNRAAERMAAADTVLAEAAYQAELADRESQYNHAMRNYERYTALYAQDAVSKEALDNMEKLMVSSRAQLDALRNQKIAGGVAAAIESKRAAREKAAHEIDALEKERSDLILRAPRAGVIGYRNAEVGAIASAGQKVLSIVDNSQMYVDCAVSEQDIAVMQIGQKLSVAVESLGKSFDGELIYISPAVDAEEKMYTARIELQNGDRLLKDGMFARGQIRVLQRASTLFVPKEAVTEKNGRMYIFVLNEDATVRLRDVTAGLRNDDDVELLSGVSPGEKVVLNNLARLKDGAAVVVEETGE